MCIISFTFGDPPKQKEPTLCLLTKQCLYVLVAHFILIQTDRSFNSKHDKSKLLILIQVDTPDDNSTVSGNEVIKYVIVCKIQNITATGLRQIRVS